MGGQGAESGSHNVQRSVCGREISNTVRIGTASLGTSDLMVASHFRNLTSPRPPTGVPLIGSKGT